MNDVDVTKARSLWAEAWRRLRRNRLAMVCLSIVSFYFALGVLDFIPVPAGSGIEEAAAGRRTLIDWAFDRTVGRPDRDASGCRWRRGHGR